MNSVMLRVFSAVFILSLCFLACKSKVADQSIAKEVQTVYDEAIALHDEVMPRMGQVKLRIEALQQAINQMNVRAEPIDQDRMNALESTQTALESAEEKINQWMRNHTEIPDPLPKDAKLPALLDEQKSQRNQIMEIKEQVSNALAQSTELLGNP